MTRQALYNKMMLGDLTLKDVIKALGGRNKVKRVRLKQPRARAFEAAMGVCERAFKNQGIKGWFSYYKGNFVFGLDETFDAACTADGPDVIPLESKVIVSKGVVKAQSRGGPVQITFLKMPETMDPLAAE